MHQPFVHLPHSFHTNSLSRRRRLLAAQLGPRKGPESRLPPAETPFSSAAAHRGAEGLAEEAPLETERGKVGLARSVLSELEDEDPNFKLPSKAQQHVWGQRLFGQILLVTRGHE